MFPTLFLMNLTGTYSLVTNGKYLKVCMCVYVCGRETEKESPDVEVVYNMCQPECVHITPCDEYHYE